MTLILGNFAGSYALFRCSTKTGKMKKIISRAGKQRSHDLNDLLFLLLGKLLVHEILDQDAGNRG